MALEGLVCSQVRHSECPQGCVPFGFRFYSMHVWVVSEDKWCSVCGALLGSWLKSFGLGDVRNSVYGRLYGVW